MMPEALRPKLSVLSEFAVSKFVWDLLVGLFRVAEDIKITAISFMNYLKGNLIL